MTESHPASVAEAKSQSDKPSTIRLVIRAEIIPDEPARTVAPRPANRRALAVIAGVVAVLALIWIGISVFRSEPAPTPVASEGAQTVEPQVPGPVISAEPPPAPAAPSAETRSEETTPVESNSTEAKAAEPEVQDEPGASPSPINEVVPNPSRNALQTIRGTIRVLVRVTIDRPGTVIAATPEDPGPSRYFERLSVDAARKWTFAPVNSEVQRTTLLRFHFTREGATARADN